MRAQKLNTARVKLGASKLIFYKGSFVRQVGRKILKPRAHAIFVVGESERRYFIQPLRLKIPPGQFGLGDSSALRLIHRARKEIIPSKRS